MSGGGAVVISGMWWFASCGAPPAPEPVVQSPSGVRAVIDAREVRLDAATRELGGRSPAVRLVGMVHVADPSFYEAVNTYFEPCARVLYESLLPDPDLPEPDDADVSDSLREVGLVFQRDALVADDRWIRTDAAAADLRAALLARPDTPPEVVDQWLVDRDRDALRGVLGAARQSERLRGVVRLSLIRGLRAPPPADPGWWEVVIGDRDALVVDQVSSAAAATPAPPGPLCVAYGADHLADLEARLIRRGWTVTARGELPVITVTLADLGLGPVQARQFLDRP